MEGKTVSFVTIENVFDVLERPPRIGPGVGTNPQFSPGQEDIAVLIFREGIIAGCPFGRCIREKVQRPEEKVLFRRFTLDPVKAKGRKDLVEACPYGHIWWNEELQLPQAWTFDAHLIDAGWKQTRGQQSCPTGAMRAVSLDDAEMAKLAREQGLEVMGAELGTKPRVYYKNLWRYSKCFIGGSVSAEANGVVDCVEGAKVRLMRNGTTVAETATDNYGDFKFDRLDEDSGEYVVEVAAAQGKKSVAAKLGASINLGEIRL